MKIFVIRGNHFRNCFEGKMLLGREEKRQSPLNKYNDRVVFKNTFFWNINKICEKIHFSWLAFRKSGI